MLPGGDVQLAASSSSRFHHRDQPGALVTCRYYAALDLTTISVERQTEYLVCADPADPCGTKVWSDYAYAKLDNLSGFGSVEATTAAKRAAEAHLACGEDWSGQPPWEPERTT